MKCRCCSNGKSIKYGRQKGKQRYRCKSCKKVFQESYDYNGSQPEISDHIRRLTKESFGIRNISRYLNISTTTVIRKIKQIAKLIKKPSVFKKNQSYEIDEMRSFIGS